MVGQCATLWRLSDSGWIKAVGWSWSMTVAERSKEVKLHLWWPLVAISYNIVSVKGREFISPPQQSQGDGMWDAGGLLLQQGIVAWAFKKVIVLTKYCLNYCHLDDPATPSPLHIISALMTRIWIDRGGVACTRWLCGSLGLIIVRSTCQTSTAANCGESCHDLLSFPAKSGPSMDQWNGNRMRRCDFVRRWWSVILFWVPHKNGNL